jgi:hypothetical protein
MTTAKKKAAPYITERQRQALDIAKAMVSGISYELLDQGDGEAAASIARRSVEIVDAVVKAAEVTA